MEETMKKIMKLLFVCFVLFISTTVSSQLPVNIDNLSDQQLVQLLAQLQFSGLSEVELEQKAREKGLSEDQIQLLKKRVATLDPSLLGTQESKTGTKDTYTPRRPVRIKLPYVNGIDSAGVLHVFGQEIFDNDYLSFEPNINIATPRNYVIGVNDELVIDIYGISETTKKLKVNTEGAIRFPNFGPIYVQGLTIEEAQQKIRSVLRKIYPGITRGNTFVNVAVGQIRSIRVTLLGEVQRPGSYTLSSLSTLMNALYASGGPSRIGSFRNIQLVRGGKTMVNFDLYDFILKGDLSNNLLLQDEDVIKISPFQTRVALKGALKKPGIFDVKNGETAADIINYAGGFSDIGYKEMVRVTRFGSNNKEILTVKTSQLPVFKFMSGDTLTVDTLADVFASRVTVNGAVYYPGAYGLNEMPTLKDVLLVTKPKEEAYYDRAIIRRYNADYTPRFINFNINDVLRGTFNIPLEREDSIYIYRLNELREKYTVTINGEVNRPGQYDYFDNMSVGDLILLAKGYRDDASLQKIEISRILRQNISGRDTAVYAIIKEVDMHAPASDTINGPGYRLTPFDIVSVRKTPSYRQQISVAVEGEVLYPGSYTLSGTMEKLSDIVNRAGGLKLTAFPVGAVLMRNTYAGRSRADNALLNSKANLINNQSGKSVINAGDSSLYSQQKPVGIKLEAAIKNPGSFYDLVMEEGDVLKIPKALQTIQTFGAVNLPKQIVYRNGLTLKDAARESGGF
ncbi:MAG: capsule biosynthesis protein, partial [Chitinophagaceae bacterium]|nr:capsule biosynthesis protein [Chitinophagaceae bacterium]